MAGMVVKNNMSAIVTLGILQTNQLRQSKSLKNVSSGVRLNDAGDDAAGYGISEKMRAQIRSLDQDNRNVQNGNSLLKVAEGAIGSTVDLLRTLKERVINAANDTNTDSDRATIQKELDQAIDQINDNANVTYNGKYLIDGSKNSKGSATYTSLTNSSLSTETNARTALTQLRDRTGAALGIQSTDNVTVSYVRDGKTFTASYAVGSTVLHDIFKKAEAIDTSNTDFATQFHEGIAKIHGASSQEVIDAADAVLDWVGTTSWLLSKAARLLEQYNRNINDCSSAISGLDTEISRVVSDSKKSSTDTNSCEYYIGSADFAKISDQYDDWKNNEKSADVEDYANPDKIRGTGTYSALYKAVHMDENTYLRNSKSAYQRYTSAYNTLDRFLNDSSTSSDTTNLRNIAIPTMREVSELGITYPIASSPGSGYDLSSYQSFYDTALLVFNEAVEKAELIGGPKVLSESRVGLSRAGDTVYTATRENAISVLANGSGVTGQIAGFTVSITDNQGNIRKAINASLDAWSETVRGENESKNDNALVLQVGTRANQSIKVALTDMRAEALGLKGRDGVTLNIGNQKNANAAINVLDNAIQKALDEETKIGSIRSRLEYTAANLTTAHENVQASESTIRDADMAKEMTEYTRNNVLVQSAQYILAHANQNSSSVLELLR